MFIVIYTLLGTQFFEFAQAVPFNLYEKVNVQYTEEVTLYFLLSAFCFGIAVEINLLNSTLVTSAKGRNILIGLANKLMYLSEKYKYLILFITFSSLVFGFGPAALIYREGYVPREGRVPQLLTVYMLSLPIASFLLAFLKNKLIKYLLFILLFMLIFGTTARMLVLLPFFYYFGSILNARRIGFVKTVLFLILVLFVFAFTLQYRAYQFQGLYPNLTNLLNNGIDFGFVNLGLNYIFSYAFFATAYGIQEFTFDLKAFLISVSPAPSSFLDIPYMLERQSLNANSPLTALTILSQGGWLLVAGFYFVVGFAVSATSQFLRVNNKVVFLISMVLFVMFTMFSVQYNLRGASRLIYYILILAFLVRFVNVFLYNARKYCGFLFISNR